jgi:hypothetical protein
MKKLVLISALLFITQLAFSQDFVSENKLWHVKDFSWDMTNTQIFKIEGDTVINSYAYKKLWSSWDSTMSYLDFEGFLREESDVVYIYKPGSGEYILYDFNLEAGDTAFVYNDFCGEVQVIVTGTDTVEYFGVPRKRWILDGWNEDYWIEGIGSNYGLVYTKLYGCVFDVYKELTCFHENDTLFYIKEGEVECFQDDVGIGEEGNVANLTISPNPVRSGQQVLIHCDKSIKSVGISNLSGFLINPYIVINQNEILISTNEFKQGLYFLRIVIEEDQFLIHKLVVL